MPSSLAQRRAPARGRPVGQRRRSARRRSPGASPAQQQVGVSGSASRRRSMRDDALQLVEEPRVDAAAARAASSAVTPRRSAAISAHRRSRSVGATRSLQASASVQARVFPEQVLARRSRASAPPSAAPPRSVRSIAMTSPVAFICVPSVRSPTANLSNGQRGILTTQ